MLFRIESFIRLDRLIFLFIFSFSNNILLIEMGGKIPREIRLQVIRKWLEGKSRDLIAHQLHIGAGRWHNQGIQKGIF